MLMVRVHPEVLTVYALLVQWIRTLVFETKNFSSTLERGTKGNDMSAKNCVKQATRNTSSKGSLNSGWDYNRAPGLKKGLRRARRRVSKEIIDNEVKEICSCSTMNGAVSS